MAAVREFRKLGVSDWLVSNCWEMGIRVPTEIQTQCIPQILKGDDVIGQAKTGSGKTAAFALPILQKLSEDPYGIFAIVLTPSRELAFQIADQFTAFAANSNFKIVTITGGLNMMKQSVELKAFPPIVIATPGRLADHLKTNDSLPLAGLKFLVLDEADRMLEPTFAPDLAVILSKIPSEGRQTLLFSATMTKSITKLQELSQRPTFVFESDTDKEFKLVEKLDQSYLFVPQSVKECYLIHLIRKLIQPEDENSEEKAVERDDADEEETESGGLKKRKKNVQEVKKDKKKKSSKKGDEDEDAVDLDTDEFGRKKPKSTCIIFVSTCKTCQILSEILLELGIECAALHSQINQARRLAALGKFRAGLVRVLVATDVASRGLDIPSVQLVVNYDVPRVSADYVHRVGRTARAGRSGQAVTLVTQYDVELFQEVESLLGRKLEEMTGIVESKVLENLRKVTAAKKMAAIRLESYQLSSKQSLKKQRHNKMRGGHHENDEFDPQMFSSSASSSSSKSFMKKRKAVANED